MSSFIFFWFRCDVYTLELVSGVIGVGGVWQNAGGIEWKGGRMEYWRCRTCSRCSMSRWKVQVVT